MNITNIFSALLVGLFIGALARFIVPGRQKIPIYLTILIGIASALVGTLVANALNVGDTEGFDWIEFFIQLGLAAVVVTLAARAWRPRRRE
ncbi:putative membrane protein YeaQ/YmgE (transglycosylase-associated protein family) [Crossiella equi]|uniref:Membrane protein YeaQ/YmgE (Transglycosylase-associated protein family) n=1 Tax=Crossiella equi TaxID=130796 RepID=A0ABS5APS4_9PSEU|nr:GlsB/YeaQ/YmgE family stress response membrane protein [Crossiella equi]MBP2478431.1 putative membrane protein YeaQ/YmgE (transglycosylase-associated protein family) [Crossiella equi]